MNRKVIIITSALIAVAAGVYAVVIARDVNNILNASRLREEAGDTVSFDEDVAAYDGPIKATASTKVYHLPGTAYYDKVGGDILFSTVEEAEEAGYRPARTGRKNS